ncbi:PorT family protein [Belliella sp. DSM 111904]|uniref:PorT family protein n=1 Tax=Belliella filtrata TaxID=2923435 RepID=A0ABS9UX96_9BACT|nr:porin family protein [Belliella filtrata]MCH7408570.1 PorT family protein [Belliella filtrata]
MKVIYLVIFFALIQCTTLNAQEGSKYQMGIKGSINFSELIGFDAIPDRDKKVGYSFGLYQNFKIKENFKLQTEVVWSLQGAEDKVKGRFNIAYINIPLLLKWEHRDFYLELGPQVGILTINSGKIEVGDQVIHDFDTIDWLANVGIGYKLAPDWYLGFRWSRGLSNLLDGMHLKNSVFSIGFSYRLH